MSGERQGFRYPLEPLRNLTQWNLDDLARELATLNSAIDTQKEQVQLLTGKFASARDEVISQRQAQTLLNINAQRLAHAYLTQVQRQLAKEREQLRGMLKQRDEMFARLNELRKFSESLSRDRETAVEEYDQKIVKQGYEEADESWLQRLNWRKQP
jgi:uncharacterized protein YdiU (UPF0061 family)